jgi:hypothetical protein
MNETEHIEVIEVGEVVDVKGHRHEWTIIVNGRPKTVHHQNLSFEQVVQLAFENPPTGPNVVFTISYTGAAGPKPHGTLTKGQSVKVKDGTVFNVRATDKS